MKIALDPYMFRRVPLTDLPGLVADLGYQYIELSPREDFLPFFVHPRAARARSSSRYGQVHSFLATSGPVMRASSGKVAAMMPRDTRIPPAVMR